MRISVNTILSTIFVAVIGIEGQLIIRPYHYTSNTRTSSNKHSIQLGRSDLDSQGRHTSYLYGLGGLLLGAAAANAIKKKIGNIELPSFKARPLCFVTEIKSTRSKRRRRRKKKPSHDTEVNTNYPQQSDEYVEDDEDDNGYYDERSYRYRIGRQYADEDNDDTNQDDSDTKPFYVYDLRQEGYEQDDEEYDDEDDDTNFFQDELLDGGIVLNTGNKGGGHGGVGHGGGGHGGIGHGGGGHGGGSHSGGGRKKTKIHCISFKPEVYEEAFGHDKYGYGGHGVKGGHGGHGGQEIHIITSGHGGGGGHGHKKPIKIIKLRSARSLETNDSETHSNS